MWYANTSLVPLPTYIFKIKTFVQLGFITWSKIMYLIERDYDALQFQGVPLDCHRELSHLPGCCTDAASRLLSAPVFPIFHCVTPRQHTARIGLSVRRNDISQLFPFAFTTCGTFQSLRVILPKGNACVPFLSPSAFVAGIDV